MVEMDAELLASRRGLLQQAVLASSISTRRVLPESEQLVNQVGQVLFTGLLGAGDVAGCYRASAAVSAERGEELRVVLRIDDPGLAGLPWEAMFDQASGTYVCRRDQLVRHVPVASVPAPLLVRVPLRILGVVCSPVDLPQLDVDKEKDQLARALARPASQGVVEVHWVPNATWAGLQEELLDGEWHVLHFIGHGDFDPDRDEGVLALAREEDGRADLVPASRLVDLLRQARPMPRLVVLNSCAGAVTGATDLFSGTAAALVRGGVPAVAAMQYKVSDSAAIAFARGFYAAVARGRGVDDAVSSGRVAILGTNDLTLEWVTPVLYLRGYEARLFNLPKLADGAEGASPGAAGQGRHGNGPAIPAGTRKARVFISYARSDPGDFLELVRSFLADQGFEIWLDVQAMPNRGRTFLDEIRRAIEDADRVVVVLGPGAAASKYVEAEWRHALLVGKPIHVVIRDLPRDQVPEPLRRLDIRRFSARNVPAELDRLGTQLKAPPAPIGPFLSPIAPLPVRYVPRPDVEARIQRFLRELADDVGPSSERVMVVAGMPGVGKTATVTACISDYAIRRLFSDGIAVVNCAELDDPRSIEANILATIGPYIHSGGGDSPLRDLRATLDGRRVLIVLENVQDATVLGEIAWLSHGVRVIVSSRNQRIGPQLGYAQMVVSCPDEATGTAVLEGWAGRSVRSAVELANRLGLHPLALRIAGSMIASGVAEDAVTELQSHPGTLAVDPELGLDFGALMAAAAGSLEAGSRELLALLGLYTVDADVPLHILRRAAGSLGPGGEYDAALDQLADRGLIDIDWSAQRLRVHRLVHCWCRDLLEHERGTASAHQSFVRTYAKNVDQLAEIRDDGYIFDHLVYHLIQGQLVDAAISLVTSEGWGDKRLVANNYNSQAVLRDLSRVCNVCVEELRHSTGAEETRHRSRSLGVLSWRACEVVARIEPKGVAVVRALVDSGLWNTARALHYAQQAIDNIEACTAVSALLDGGSLLSDQDNRLAQSILVDRLDRAIDERDFDDRFIPCILEARRHLEDSSIDALVDIVRRAGTPFNVSRAAICLLRSFPHDDRIRALVMDGVDSHIESNERATLIAKAADYIEDAPLLERLYAAAGDLDERTRPWAVIGLALARPEYWQREDRADLHQAANDNYLLELSLAFQDKMDRDLAEFILANEDYGVAVDFVTATVLYPHLSAASQDAWRAGLLDRARFEIGFAARSGMLLYHVERYADVLVRYAAVAPSLDNEHLGELLSLADLMPASRSSAVLLLSLLEYCHGEATRSAVGQRLRRVLAELGDGTDIEVRCDAFSRGLRDISGPEEVLLGQVSAVDDPSTRSRCLDLVCPHVSRGGLRILAGRNVKPAERVWINVIARSDPATIMADLQEWGGADSDDAAWPRTLRRLLAMDNLARKDRNRAEAALLRSCAEPQLEAEPMQLEQSMVARVFNEYKWILDFSDSFPVLGPEAVSASLSFLEENVPDSPDALSKRSPEEFTIFSHVTRWLYVATRLERRRRTGKLSVPKVYYLAPALRYAMPALSEKSGERVRRRTVTFEASVTEAVEHIIRWCDKWHGYGDSPAFLGDVSRRPIDRYYGLAVLVELLPHVSAVMRRRIFGCVEAEIRWILPVHALTLIGAVTENAEPDEIDRVTAAAGLDREDPRWIRALLLAHADFPAGAQRCDLGIAVLRYAVGLAFQGPSACLLGLAELSAHTDDIASHVRFDVAALLASVIDSALGSTTRPALE